MRLGTRTRLFVATLLPVRAAGIARAIVLHVDVARDTEPQAWVALERIRDALAPRIAAATDDELDRIARIAGQSTGVRVTVIAGEGRVLADSQVPPDRVDALDNHARRPEVVQAMADGSGRSRRYSDTLRAPLFYAATRIDATDGPRILRLAYAVHEIEGRALRRNLAVLGFTAFAMALGALGAWAVSTLVARRLRRMAEAARRLADGHYDERVDDRQGDELGRLADALNRLAASNAATFSRLQAEGRRVNAILQAMHQGVMAIDRDGRIVLINDAMCRLAAWEGPAEGRLPSDLVRTPELLTAIAEAQAGRPTLREVSVVHPTPLMLLVHASPLPEGGGVLVVASETTELHRVHQMRRDFVANLSHELRNPIGTLQAALETLGEIRAGTDPDPQAESRLLETMTRQAARMSNLVRDLLDLARIESGQHAMAPQAIDLPALLADVAASFHDRAAARDIGIAVDAGDVPSLRTDPEALQTVLGNLVDNAIQYSRPGDRVRIAASRNAEGRIEIAVSDTGPGIAEAHLPRLFERFYRVDAGRSREAGGTGLGLAIVKHLCAAMGGGVRVHSRLGAGSTFVVGLPDSTT
jgi:two-component system phosphate regulon sensor histidine kinase PhoR